jgi:hypothetical protein
MSPSYARGVATPGTVIGGRFRVDHVLGSGGMGVVVSATHLELGHRVAIKFLRDDMARTATVVERFLREARAAVQLRTEHVCRVFDVGRTDTGAPYIVMELLDGTDLGHAIASQPLPVTIAVEYVMQACVAVAEAHAAGIIHRDLKPANLIVTRRPGGGPLIKVLDFGIAKAISEAGAQLTRSQSMLGSPGYISPEQLQSARDVDVRTDLWALGATLYQLLSGRLPFHGQTATAMAVRIMTEPPDPLDVDPALRAVIFRCLEKSPLQRYPDVAALVTALAPFGGPSGRAIAALVERMLRGSIAAPTALPVISPFAATAANSAASSEVSPFVATAPASVGSVAGSPPRATAAPSVASIAKHRTRGEPAIRPGARPRGMPTNGLVARIRRRPWWWIAAPLVVLASAGTALICGGRDTTTVSAPGSAAVVAAVDDRTAVPVPIDARAADPSPVAAPPDAGLPARTADTRHRDTRAKDARPKDPRGGATQPQAAQVRDSTAHTTTRRASGSGHEPTKPPVGRTVAETAREAKDTCLESAADTPWNTAMCWCTKKDQARAAAAFAKLSGFKRASVRQYCAVRGINL